METLKVNRCVVGQKGDGGAGRKDGRGGRRR
jgi:hypothetical protein